MESGAFGIIARWRSSIVCVKTEKKLEKYWILLMDVSGFASLVASANFSSLAYAPFRGAYGSGRAAEWPRAFFGLCPAGIRPHGAALQRFFVCADEILSRQVSGFRAGHGAGKKLPKI